MGAGVQPRGPRARGSSAPAEAEVVGDVPEVGVLAAVPGVEERLGHLAVAGLARLVVETSPCGRAATGVAEGAVEVEGMVCSRRLVSARPCKGTECASVAVDCMDSQ